MIDVSGNDKRRAFTAWLRTGRLPPPLGAGGLELKFNPWHDPRDGRFTFAGTGRHHGASGVDKANGPHARASVRIDRPRSRSDRSKSQTATLPTAQVPHAPGGRRSIGGSVREQSARIPAPRSGNQPNPGTEFVVGVGQGLYNVGKDTLTGLEAVVTTKPATTIRNIGRGIAGSINTMVAAEDTPARVQMARAADAVANASARDIGRAVGAVAGNVALTVAPGAALSRISTLRHLRGARPRISYDPPQIGWVKETTRSDKPWKAYNDSAPGARPDKAPTLMRTMPDGSKRPVKFDGVQGDYMIDRK